MPFGGRFPDEFSGQKKPKAIRSTETSTDFFSKAAQINRVMFPSIGQAAADMSRRRVNPANFPMQGYAKRQSTKADQPARAKFRRARQAAGRVRLKIPGLGGF